MMHSLAPTGGLERDAIKCLRIWAKQNRFVDVVAAFLHPAVPAMFSDAPRIHWHRIRTIKRPVPVGQFWLWRRQKRWARAWKRTHSDGVIVCFEWLPVAEYSVGGQPPRIWHEARAQMGLFTWHRPIQRLWEGFVERHLLRRARMFVVYSIQAREAFLKRGVDPQKVIRVLVPTDTRFFHPRPNTERCSVLIMGANPVLKGIDLALHAWPTIAQKHPELELHIVTKSSRVARIAKRFADLRVRVFSPVQDPRVYYDRARLVLAPSRFETWCNVVPEAIASGIPVLTSTQVPAHELIQHPWLGGVIPRSKNLSHDASALIEEAERLLAMPMDPATMQRRHRFLEQYQQSQPTLEDWAESL